MNTAVDALIADRSIPLEEVDTRLRFLSDQAVDLQRKWHTHQPTGPEQRQVLTDVLRESLISAAPRTTIFANKQIRSGVSLHFQDYPMTLMESPDGITVDLHLIESREYDQFRRDVLNDSTSPAMNKTIHAPAAVDDAILQDIRDVYASSRMIRDLRPKTRDADEEEFFRSLQDREKRAKARIADALEIAVHNGTVIFHGQDVPVMTGAPSFKSAIEGALSKVGEVVYEKYRHAAVTVQQSTAEKILKAKDVSTITSTDDPLKLLPDGQGETFAESHAAVIDITDYINSHGSVIETLIDQARDVVSMGNGLDLQICDDAKILSSDLATLSKSEQANLIKAFGNEDNSLVSRIQLLRRNHELLEGSFGELLYVGRRMLSSIEELPDTGELADVKTETAERRSELESLYDDSELCDRQPRVQELIGEIEDILDTACVKEYQRLEIEAEREAEEVQAGSDWSDLDESSREQAGNKLEAMITAVDAVPADTKIRFKTR